MRKKIALVEDDDVIRENCAELLSRAGFAVEGYATKEAALGAFRSAVPDLAILDIALGDERDAGFELCSVLRSLSATVPIVFLTSHDGDIDKISGLRLGADEYLTKDASIDYLIVRIETLFRRLERLAAAGAHADSVGPGAPQAPLQIDESLSRAKWRGREVELSLTQFWMLRELCRREGQVVSHTDLMRAARIVVEPNTITAHVKAIRDAFRRIDPGFACIRTERGRGYRWTPPADSSAITSAVAAARQ